MTPTPGRLRLRNGLEASVSPDGWASRSKPLARLLAALFPPPPTEAGVPFVLAFWAAVGGTGATVIQEPHPEERK